MDAKFHPAIAAIKSGDLVELKALLSHDSSLATARSSRSHPTLLQCLTLDAVDVPNKVEMAQVLINAGAEISEPLVAAASIGNVEIAAFLLDCGAAINGVGNWSPLEEALYWGNQGVIDLLIKRGATLHNLRIASGLGQIDLIEGFFNSDGSLKPEAGKIEWPFQEPEKSSLPMKIKAELGAKIAKALLITPSSMLACITTSRPRAYCCRKAHKSTLSQPVLISQERACTMRRSTAIERWLSFLSKRARM